MSLPTSALRADGSLRSVSEQYLGHLGRRCEPENVELYVRTNVGGLQAAGMHSKPLTIHSGCILRAMTDAGLSPAALDSIYEIMRCGTCAVKTDVAVLVLVDPELNDWADALGCDGVDREKMLGILVYDGRHAAEIVSVGAYAARDIEFVFRDAPDVSVHPSWYPYGDMALLVEKMRAQGMTEEWLNRMEGAGRDSVQGQRSSRRRGNDAEGRHATAFSGRGTTNER